MTESTNESEMDPQMHTPGMMWLGARREIGFEYRRHSSTGEIRYV